MTPCLLCPFQTAWKLPHGCLPLVLSADGGLPTWPPVQLLPRWATLPVSLCCFKYLLSAAILRAQVRLSDPGAPPPCLSCRSCTNPQLYHESLYILKVIYTPFAPRWKHSFLSGKAGLSTCHCNAKCLLSSHSPTKGYGGVFWGSPLLCTPLHNILALDCYFFWGTASTKAKLDSN